MAGKPWQNANKVSGTSGWIHDAPFLLQSKKTYLFEPYTKKGSPAPSWALWEKETVCALPGHSARFFIFAKLWCPLSGAKPMGQCRMLSGMLWHTLCSLSSGSSKPQWTCWVTSLCNWWCCLLGPVAKGSPSGKAPWGTSFSSSIHSYYLHPLWKAAISFPLGPCPNWTPDPWRPSSLIVPSGGRSIQTRWLTRWEGPNKPPFVKRKEYIQEHSWPGSSSILASEENGTAIPLGENLFPTLPTIAQGCWALWSTWFIDDSSNAWTWSTNHWA